MLFIYAYVPLHRKMNKAPKSEWNKKWINPVLKSNTIYKKPNPNTQLKNSMNVVFSHLWLSLTTFSEAAC